jgi:hypothetical protein
MILALTSSREIYFLNVDFVSDVSDAISASIIRDLCSECCVRTLCIYAHSCLLTQPGPRAWETVGEEREKTKWGGVVRHTTLKEGQENVSYPG